MLLYGRRQTYYAVLQLLSLLKLPLLATLLAVFPMGQRGNFQLTIFAQVWRTSPDWNRPGSVLSSPTLS
jgi:hypothetical protein